MDAFWILISSLVARLRAGGFKLLDTQFVTAHLSRLGAIEISRARYHQMLEEAVKSRADFYSLPGDASPGLALQLSTQTS